MELHTLIACPSGISSRRGCTFHRRERNLVIPLSSLPNDQSRRHLDMKIMITPSEDHGATFYDAYFKKKIGSFVRDRDPQSNRGKILIVLVSHNRIMHTEKEKSVVFYKIFPGNRNVSTVYLYVLCLHKDEEFAFDLIDDKDEPRSYSLKHSNLTQSIEVIDLFEENHRHRPQPLTAWQRLLKQICNSAYNYFHPFGKWRV